MARGIVIPFTADLRKWGQAIRNVGRDLDDTVDALQDVERAGEKAAAGIESELESAADDVEAAFASLGDDVKDEFDRMERAARQAGDDIDRGLGQGMEGTSVRAAGGVLAGEVFDEFIESWGEAVRSGDYGEAIRETFSNLGQIGGAVGGPVGAAAGAIGGLFLTNLYDKISADRERQGQIAAAIRDLFLGVADDAADAGGASWVAYRDAVVAAAKSDEAIASALGVESFADAIGLIESAGEKLGQSWENDVILALTDSGTAGQQAAQRVQTAWEESSAVLAGLERDRQTLIASGQGDQLGNIDALISEERRRNDQLAIGAGWLTDQNTIADGLVSTAQEQWRRDQLVTTEKQDQAAAARGTRDATATTRDKDLPRLTRSTRAAADAAQATKDAAGSVPDISVKAKVDRREIDNLPTSKTIDVTLRAKVKAADAKAQRLLDQGLV